MNTYTAAPGDSVRIHAADVEHPDSGAVTSGLTGSVTIKKRYSGAPVAGPFPITENSGNDWHVDIVAPTERGSYRVEIAISALGAARTLPLELQVR